MNRVPQIQVPGAERLRQSELPDLTTAWTQANGYSVAEDGLNLHDQRLRNPSGVSGTQLDGYFADLPPPAPYTPNPFNDWQHDAQFVIRLPRHWNGGLVLSPPPGNRRQYAGDAIIGDWVLAAGYAYASTDKGNWGPEFYLDGGAPGDAIAEWHRRVRELCIGARAAVEQAYGRLPERVYLFGLSNGGYCVRYALEHDPALYDGGVDWAGTFWHAAGPNMLTCLPAALRWFPRYTAPDSSAAQRAAAYAAMVEAGFAPGSEALWPLYHEVYWKLTQHIYRRVFDPGYNSDDADYRYFERPAGVQTAVERIALSGSLTRKLITVHGSLDALLPPLTNADAYVELLSRHGSAQYHRDYRIEGGQHTDGYAANFPTLAQPMLPFARAAFTALVRWVERGVAPPDSCSVGYEQDHSAITG